MRSSPRSRTTAWASREPPRTAYSNASTRSTVLGCVPRPEAGRVSGSRSRATSSSSTAGGSGSNPRKVAALRSRSPCPPTTAMTPDREDRLDRLHVATLNILNLADPWPERLPLILADMAALQPDLLGLQEVVYVMQQDRIIGAAGEGRYAAVRGWAGRPEYGNSLLIREPLAATQVDRLDLGLGRSAHRAVVALPGGATLLVVVTHLHHTVDGDMQRDEQAAAILGWLDVA